MNQLLKVTIVVSMIVIEFTACKTEEPEAFWYSYGTYLNPTGETNDFIVKLDNGTTLIPMVSEGIQNGVEDSSRVVVTYAIVSEISDTIKAKVIEVADILTKGILQLTANNMDSIGNDKVQLSNNEIWLSEFHLNFVFGYYYGGATTHYINLVKPIGEQLDENGRQILEFKHNDNNDPYNYWILSVVSFDMRSIYTDGMDSINFVVHSNNFDNSDFKWEGTYYFNNANSSSVAKIGEPKFNKMIE
ncbi:MAG: NigD-like C-terminal domain-containing protein [Salinivirgaceae bacterium]|jgi:hypothetical protein